MASSPTGCACTPICRAVVRDYLLRSFSGSMASEHHRPGEHVFVLLDGRGEPLRELLNTERLLRRADGADLEGILNDLRLAEHLLAAGPGAMRLDGLEDMLFLESPDNAVVSSTRVAAPDGSAVAREIGGLFRAARATSACTCSERPTSVAQQGRRPC